MRVFHCSLYVHFVCHSLKHSFHYTQLYNVSATLQLLSYLNLFSRCYRLPLSLLLNPRSRSISPSSPVRSGLSVLGVRKRRRGRVAEVAFPRGHGRPQRGLVRGRVPNLPLRHRQQPHLLLLVWGGRDLQPLADQPQTNQGHPQQPADQSHLSHTGIGGGGRRA